MAAVLCLLCEGPCESLDHPAAPLRPGGAVDFCCDGCYANLIASVAPRPDLACEGCGAPFGKGCRCVENGRAIARGEARKAREEEKC